MALLQSKRKLLGQVLAAAWKDEAARDQLLVEFRSRGLSASEAMPALWHADAAVREAARDVFSERADAAAVVELLRHSGGHPARTRGAFDAVSPRVPLDAIRKALDSLISAPDPADRRVGWEYALAGADPLRRRYQRRALQEAGPGLRLKVLQQLQADHEPAKIVTDLLLAAEDEDSRVSELALSALVRVRDRRVAELMFRLLASEDATRAGVAEQYLAREAKQDPQGAIPAMRPLLATGDRSVRERAVRVLLDSGEPTQVLAELLHWCSRLLGWLRAGVLDAMVAGGERSVAPLLELLRHPDAKTRSHALMLADRLDDGRLVPPMCALLDDEDWWIRISACDQLGRLGDETAIRPLVGALEDDRVRWAAIAALGRLGRPEALQPLVNLLNDPRRDLRLEVLEACDHFTDQRLLPVLQKVESGDPDAEVRRRAAEVVRKMAGRLDVEMGPAKTTIGELGDEAPPLDRLLARARRMGASDLHISVGEPPMVRLNGQLTKLGDIEPLTGEQSVALLGAALGKGERTALAERRAAELCYEVPELGRHRANFYIQQRGLCGTFRLIPRDPPSYADLGLPVQLRGLLDQQVGLILVAGATGSGKSTTLASLVDRINETRPVHIVTLEDPIEFVHPRKTALVSQRQVGRDTQGFARGLRAALREDPDVIVVGELRDLETMRMALEAGETGHLVLATLATASAVQTVDQVMATFPPDEREQASAILSKSLKLVLCQRLMPRRDHAGRVAVFEILRGTPAIGHMIRKGTTHQIPGAIQIGRAVGMQTFEQAIEELAERGVVAPGTGQRATGAT